jgi:hypothetical protein
MGNTDSNELPTGYLEFIEPYVRLGHVQDHRVGGITVWAKKDGSGEQIALKEKWANTPEEYAQLHGPIDHRTRLDTSSKAKILQSYAKSETKMCSEFYKFYVFHEWFSKTLNDHIL